MSGELQSSHTFLEIQLWVKKIVNQFGKMALLHESQKPGHRFKILAYVASVQHLHHEIKLKMVDLADVDDGKLDDLAILEQRIDSLRMLILHHFAIQHRELVEKIGTVAEQFPELSRRVVNRLRDEDSSMFQNGGLSSNGLTDDSSLRLPSQSLGSSLNSSSLRR